MLRKHLINIEFLVQAVRD